MDDRRIGRKIWSKYWNTCIRSNKDFIARLNYIHWNPVKHGLVDDPKDYPYSSYQNYFAENVKEIKRHEMNALLNSIKDITDDF